MKTALLLLAVAGCAWTVDARARFVGTWKLVSYELRSHSGEITYPRGRDPVGRITYDSAGRMTVQIMQRDRTRFASIDSRGATPAEAEAAFRGYTAYFGTYTINDKAGFVMHHVEASLFPNWAGSDQKRFFKLEGNRLTLEADLTAGRAKLVWEKLP